MSKLIFASGNEKLKEQVSAALAGSRHSIFYLRNAWLLPELLEENRDTSLLIFDANIFEEKGGFEEAMNFLSTLRAVPGGKSLPFIILSKKIGFRKVESFLELGQTYFLPVPINAPSLLDYVERVVASAKRCSEESGASVVA